MTSPSASTCRLIRRPLTSVPLVEPRSSTVAFPLSRITSTCLRLTPVSGSRMSASVPRPMTLRPVVNSCRVPGPSTTSRWVTPERVPARPTIDGSWRPVSVATRPRSGGRGGSGGRLVRLGPALQAALGPSHPRSETVFRMAVGHANRREPNVRSFRALWGYWQFLCICGRNRDAAALADEIVQMAPALRDDGLQLEACHAAMTTHALLGDAPAVVENAARIIAVYDRDRHHSLAFSFGGHDPGVCALGQGAWGLWLVG